MKSIQQLQEEWVKVGYRFAVRAYPENVDLEDLIINSLDAGRNEPSLLWALLTWLIHFSDLLNIHRLFRLLDRSYEPVLGALAETALTRGANNKLKYVVKKCRPQHYPEILFYSMRETKVTAELEAQHCLPIFKKWGVYTSAITLKEDALHNRAYILKKNRNLAIRAVFGANTRAEILFSLSQKSSTYISQLAEHIGLSYQPVYAEIKHLILNGVLECEHIGKMKVVSLSPRTVAFIRMLPVG